MSNNKLYFHIGTHKTGSSALQSVFRDTEKELRNEKTAYLGAPAYHQSFGLATEFDKELVDKYTKDLRTQIKRERYLFGCNKFIVSSEAFSGNANSGYTNAFYIAKMLKNVADRLNINTAVILYLRRQDDFIQSLYTQRIHEGFSYTFDQFMHDKIDIESFNWLKLTEHYKTQFGDKAFVVKRYGRQYLPQKNSLINQFGEIVGSETLKSYTSTRMVNRSMSRDALEIARIANEYLNDTEKKRLRKLLQKISPKSLFGNHDFMNYRQREQIYNLCKVNNAVVACEYFDEKELFPQPIESSNEDVYKGLSNEAIIIHLIKMILESENKENKEPKNVSSFKNTGKKLIEVIPGAKRLAKIIFGRYNG